MTLSDAPNTTSAPAAPAVPPAISGESQSENPAEASVRPPLFTTIRQAIWIEVGTILCGVVTAVEVFLVLWVFWAGIAFLGAGGSAGKPTPFPHWLLITPVVVGFLTIIAVVIRLFVLASKRRRDGLHVNKIEAISKDVTELLVISAAILFGLIWAMLKS